jgi:hypothetical protein
MSFGNKAIIMPKDIKISMYYNGEGELVQGLPYKCIELSQ